jgi:Uri superfamily endonuclease
MDVLPHQTGIYALILELIQLRELAIGRMGRFEFPAGFYIYLGSAQGPGGIRGRLGRHLRGAYKPHWHIDFLRIESEIRGYGYVLDNGDSRLAPTECCWFQKLAAIPNTKIPVPKFGASDCQSGCRAHLIHFPALPELNELRRPLSNIDGFSRGIILRLTEP